MTHWRRVNKRKGWCGDTTNTSYFSNVRLTPPILSCIRFSFEYLTLSYRLMLDCCPKFTQSSTLNDQTFSNRRIFQRSIDLIPEPIVICGRLTANDELERQNALKRSNFPAIDRFDTRTNRHLWPIDLKRWALTSKRSQTVEFSSDRSVWHPKRLSLVTDQPQTMSSNV